MKLSVTIPEAVHRAAKFEAVQNGWTLSALLAGIIEARVKQSRLKRPTNRAAANGDATVRPSVMVSPPIARQLAEIAMDQKLSEPELAARLIIHHFRP